MEASRFDSDGGVGASEGAESSTPAFPRVLVLNSSFEPIRIVSWQRAMILLLGEKVEVLENHDIEIHSPSRAFRLPSVLKMRRFVRLKRSANVLRFSRQHVFLRDGFECQYCSKPYPVKDLTLDHVVPVMRGGQKTWTNIVTSCGRCNQRKGSRTPQEAGFKNFRLPREPQAGFLPDLLFLKGSVPPTWKPYLEWLF